ncbi:hypothetical protein [Pseudomonas sp.]|uniref:hypothetical protein n=1 Tax=Pseudomonas sp. TaxID=306 RepID=UPI0040545ADB
MSLVPFTPWPAEFAALYRQAGYWRGEPLTHLLEEQVQAQPEAIALICGERQLSYAELDVQATYLAQRFPRCQASCRLS